MKKLTERELATILAALRAWQEMGGIDAPVSLAIKEIASDNYRVKPLKLHEIDKLCERLDTET